jgi:hypothetical protein
VRARIPNGRPWLPLDGFNLTAGNATASAEAICLMFGLITLLHVFTRHATCRWVYFDIAWVPVGHGHRQASEYRADRRALWAGSDPEQANGASSGPLFGNNIIRAPDSLIGRRELACNSTILGVLSTDLSAK